jgi:hypothetical protein
MRSFFVTVSCIAFGLCVSACSLTRAKPIQLAASLDEFAPHADRDHFVFLWERIAGGQRVAQGIQVEHVSTSETAGEFEVTLSEDGVPAGRLSIRDDGHALLLVSEDDLSRGIRFSYDPPLPQLTAPLFAGERRAAALATVRQLADGQPLGTVQVTQVTEAHAAPTVHTPFGEYKHAVLLRTVRTLYFSEGITELQTSMVLAPGIGEVRSEGTASGAALLRRELACARIGGHAIGNCQDLQKRLEELHDARPTHDR